MRARLLFSRVNSDLCFPVPYLTPSSCVMRYMVNKNYSVSSLA